MAKKEEKVKEEKSELLIISGLGETTLEKLTTNGISTLMGLATQSPANIADMCGISENVARKMIQSARENLNLGFEVASKYAKKRDKIKKIGTGCTNFDEMLEGGFESGHINEVFGQYGTGKTQLAHLLVAQALKENKDNKAIYLDTESTFRADRLIDFSKALGMEEEDVMERVFVARAYNSEHQMLLTDEIEKMLQKDNSYRIIIVDSLTSHFRSEFIGRGTLATRQQMLNKHMHQLIKMADIYNMVVLVTNQVSSSPASFFGDPTMPVGGHIVGHNSCIRIYLRPGKQGCIHAKLTDSPNMPNNECNYNIRESGFENV